MALHLDRQAEIVRILSRNGFHLLVARSGLARRLPLPGFLDALTPDALHVDEALNSPEIIRRTLQELGPTFIKLGQILSTRPDLVHPELAAQLTMLQDQDPPMPIEQTRRLQPSSVARRLLTFSLDSLELGLPLPERLSHLLDRYEQEGMGVSIDPVQLEPYVRRVENMSERLVAGMLLASLITAIGSLGATDRKWLAKARGPLLVIGSVAAAGLGSFIAINARIAQLRLHRMR
jgi:hypothetical protein